MSTLANFRNVVGRKTGLDQNVGTAECALMDEWANQAVIEILIRTHCKVECATLNTTANSWKYELPSVLAILDIWKEDSTGIDILQRTDYDNILALRRSSAAGSGTVIRYALAGANLLLIDPTPTEEYALSIFYVPRPTVMSDGSHDPSDAAYGGIPSEYHKGIEYYMLWQAADYDDDKSSQYGAAYQAAFDDFVRNFILPAIHRRGGSRLPPARRNIRKPVPRENSVYP